MSSIRWYLINWGSYIKYNRTEYLGYPKKCPFIDGPGVIRCTGGGDDMPEDVEEVDKIVCSDSFPEEYRLALYCRYVYGLSLRKSAEVLRINRETLRRQTNKAEQVVWRRM